MMKIYNNRIIKHSLMVAWFNERQEKIEISRDTASSYLAVRYGPQDNGAIQMFESQETDPRVLARQALREYGLEADALADLELEIDVIDIEEHVKMAFRRSSTRLLRGASEMKEHEALVLVIDLRGFSDFIKNDKRNSAMELIKAFNGNALTLVNHLNVDYYKLMGDGLLAIWDRLDYDSVGLGLHFFEEMALSIEDVKATTNYTGGFGGALVGGPVLKYEMSSEMAGLSFVDYVGYNVNFAFRLQGKAKARQLLVNERVLNLLPAGLEGERRSHQLKGITREDSSRLFLVTGLPL